MSTQYCVIPLCEWESVTTRGERHLCAQCAQAFDAGVEYAQRQTKSQPTKVIFRIFPKSEDRAVIALFPAVASTVGRPDLCQSYMHQGQHGAADLRGLTRKLRLATPGEYAELKRELERVGYTLEIVKRTTAADTKARKEQLKP